jgi:DNA gyrase subunit A
MIYGTAGISDAYRTWARHHPSAGPHGRSKRRKKPAARPLLISELPYQVNKAKLIEKIAAMISQKQLEGIRFIRDESDREGMRVAIRLKRDQVPEIIINQLYKHTRLAVTFGIIFLAVVNNRPELLTLKEILEHFIGHRRQISSSAAPASI